MGWELNLVVGPNNIGGFSYGSSVWDLCDIILSCYLHGMKRRFPADNLTVQ
jgi:hypothetical protein